MLEKQNSTDVKCLEIIESIASVQYTEFVPWCPRCGRELMHYSSSQPRTFGSLSRRADIYICDECGTDEAYEDYYGYEKLPISEWAMFADTDEEEL